MIDHLAIPVREWLRQRPPGPSDDRENYVAVFVTDPDGNNVEAVRREEF